MSVFKNDLNLSLLFLIVIIMVLFVGFSANYQVKIKNMEDEYDEKAQQLKELNKQLMEEKLKVQKYYELNDLTQKDKEALENGCYSLIHEIESLEEEKRTLQEKLNFEGITGRVFQKTLCKTTGDVICHD